MFVDCDLFWTHCYQNQLIYAGCLLLPPECHLSRSLEVIEDRERRGVEREREKGGERAGRRGRETEGEREGKGEMEKKNYSRDQQLQTQMCRGQILSHLASLIGAIVHAAHSSIKQYFHTTRLLSQN